MSTTTTPSLDAVGAALVAAHQAVEQRAAATPADATSDQTLSEALVALACAACDAVSAWEQASFVAVPDEEELRPVTDRVTTWRGQLDELRVQAALAEMDLRDSSHRTLAAVEQSVVETERRLTGAVREIGGALAGFRSDLQRRLR